MSKDEDHDARDSASATDEATVELVELLRRASPQERAALSSLLYGSKRAAESSPEALVRKLCLTGGRWMSTVVLGRGAPYGQIVLGIYRRFRRQQVIAGKAGIPRWVPDGQALDRPLNQSLRGIGDFDPTDIPDAEARIVAHVFSTLVDTMSADRRRTFEQELASLARSYDLPFLGLGVAGSHFVVAGDALPANRLTALALFHGVGLVRRNLLPVMSHRRATLSLEMTPIVWAWRRCLMRCGGILRNRRFEKTIAAIALVRALRCRIATTG
jgi:hypothetical protein